MYDGSRATRRVAPSIALAALAAISACGGSAESSNGALGADASAEGASAAGGGSGTRATGGAAGSAASATGGGSGLGGSGLGGSGLGGSGTGGSGTGGSGMGAIGGTAGSSGSAGSSGAGDGAACGDLDQPCCGGDTCNPGLACSGIVGNPSTYRCYHCGNDGEPCCTSGAECASGLICSLTVDTGRRCQPGGTDATARSCLPSGGCTDGPQCGTGCCAAKEWCDTSGSTPVCRCGDLAACAAGASCVSNIGGAECGFACCPPLCPP